jgi:ribokinase
MTSLAPEGGTAPERQVAVGTSPRPAIVVAGGINLDMVVRTPRLPQPGETIHGRDLVQVPGGKGANQAAAVARLGGEARLLAMVGDDDAGRILLRSVTDDSIDARWVQVVVGVDSGVALIAVADDGSNTIIVAPGANARADAATVIAAAGAFAGAQVVMGQLEWPFGAVQALLEQAPKGTQRILNAAPAERRAVDLLPQVDWLIVNEVEASLLAAMDIQDETSALRAAHQLCHRGVDHALITLGSRGAVLLGPNGARLQPAPPVKVVDTTAAGDAFAGAIAVALGEGLADADAVQLAVAAGSLACTVLGARPSLPTRAAVDLFLARVPEGRRA